MKKMKFLTFLTIASLSFASFADDFADFGDFGSFDDVSSSSNENPLEIDGKSSFEIRSYIDKDDIDDVVMKAIPEAQINFKFNTQKTDSLINFKFNEEIIKNHPEDILNEVVLSSYFDFVTIQAGKMKIVWGKGDKYHVIDNFNSDDYSDFIIPDYLERRRSTPMVKVDFNIPAGNMKFETVYAPLLTVDNFATSGCWVPSQVTKLTDTVTSSAQSYVAKTFEAYTTAVKTSSDPIAIQSAATSYMLALNAANALSSNQDSIYPDLNTLKYGQFGGRLTGTIGSFDLGISYYNGFYKQPSVDATKIESWLSKIMNGTATEEDKFLSYDRKQTFGIEAAKTIWRFNTRAEGAFNLTEDSDGTKTAVHNNSVAWLLGFDVDLPFWNANFNLQESGNYILNNDEIDKNEYDIEYNENGYVSNKLILNFTTSFKNEKILPEITAIWGIENNDLAVIPKLSYKPDSALMFTAKGLYIYSDNENSEFYGWKDNSFVSLSVSYQF